MSRNIQALVNLHPFIRLTAVVAVAGYFIARALAGYGRLSVVGSMRLDWLRFLDLAPLVLELSVIPLVVLCLMSDRTRDLANARFILGLFLMGEGLLWFTFLLREYNEVYWYLTQSIDAVWVAQVVSLRMLAAIGFVVGGACVWRARERVWLGPALVGTAIGLLVIGTAYAGEWRSFGRDLSRTESKIRSVLDCIQTDSWPGWSFWFVYAVSCFAALAPADWRSRWFPGAGFQAEEGLGSRATNTPAGRGRRDLEAADSPLEFH